MVIETGWDDFLGDYMFDSATILNRARGGRSSKSFYDENDNAWSESDDAVMKGIEPGDYVLIQFGHNDHYIVDVDSGHTDSGSPPDYEGSFRDHLELYVDQTRAKGAIPILITPVQTMWFAQDGMPWREHGDYPGAVRKLASDKDVVMLDLEQRSFDVFSELGEEARVEQYAWDGLLYGTLIECIFLLTKPLGLPRWWLIY